MECLSRATACIIDTTLHSCSLIARAGEACCLTPCFFSFGLLYADFFLKKLQIKNKFYELDHENTLNLMIASTIFSLFFRIIQECVNPYIKDRNRKRRIAEYHRACLIELEKMNRETLPHQNSLQQQPQANPFDWLTAPGTTVSEQVDSQQLEVARPGAKKV